MIPGVTSTSTTEQSESINSQDMWVINSTLSNDILTTPDHHDEEGNGQKTTPNIVAFVLSGAEDLAEHLNLMIITFVI